MDPIPEDDERYMEYYQLYGQVYEHPKYDYLTPAKLREQYDLL